MSERVAVPGASSWIVSPAWDFSFLIASPLVIIPVMAILASEAVTPEHLALAVFAFATVGHHLPGYMRA